MAGYLSGQRQRAVSTKSFELGRVLTETRDRGVMLL
jgi:hypothetical protein